MILMESGFKTSPGIEGRGLLSLQEAMTSKRKKAIICRKENMG